MQITPLPSREGQGGGSSFSFVELNCENLFDCHHDSLKEDEAFLPEGTYHWTYGKYWKKVNNIGREILACGEQTDGTFSLPDIVALCEVENDTVVRDLTERSLLRNAGYKYVITHSPDLRGIDVALLYSPLSFSLIESRSIRVNPLKGMRPTRDILYVKGRTAGDDTLHIFVVHAPSRTGGEYQTRPNRMLVARRLTESVDSLRRYSPEAKVVVMGDFNDYSGDPSIKHIETFGLTDVSATATSINGQAKDTYKFHGEWGSLDHIFLSPSLLNSQPHQLHQPPICQIGDFPFLLCPDETYGGMTPNRNFQGIKWCNGFSDHLPLILRF